MPKYKTYHGRRNKRWGRIAAVLVIVAVLAAAGIFLWQNTTITDDGIQINLPFFETTISRTPRTPEPDGNHVEIVIEDPEISPPQADEEVPPELDEPESEPPSEAVRALFLPLEALSNTELLEEARAGALRDEINLIALEYLSTDGAVAGGEVVETALNILNSPRFEVSAVISVGVNNLIPRQGPNTAWGLRRGSGHNFGDANRNRWLNLHLPEVREFIGSLITEAYDLGFARVMLTNLGFPHTGDFHNIRFTDDQLATGHVRAVNDFIADLRETAGGRPLDAEVFFQTASQGRFLEAGQNLTRFTETFDNVFVTLPQDETFIQPPVIPILPFGGGTDITDSIELSRQGFMLHNPQGVYSN